VFMEVIDLVRKLRDKTALVTGASRQIGRAIAQRLAADGALVAINYRGNEDAVNEVLAVIEQAGGDAFLVQAELGCEWRRRHTVHQTSRKRWQGGR